METILSIIISSIIAIAITWYFTRMQMKKNEISHFAINSYNVGKGLHNEFPKFKLTYEEKELLDEVMVLKGGFINIGRNDITGLKNNSDINLILPEGCSIKDVQLRRLSNDLDVKGCVNKDAPNIISFGIDEKFMSGESFEYTAIIESVKEIKNLHKKIEFKHRIPNTSKIRNEYVITVPIIKANKSTSLLIKEKSFGFVFLISAIIFGLFSLFFFFVQRVQYSLYEKGTDKETTLYMTPKSIFYVSDNDLIPFYDNKKVSKEEIDNNYYILPKTKFSWCSDNSIIGIVLAILAIVYFVSALMPFYAWNRKKRIYQLIEQYQKE